MNEPRFERTPRGTLAAFVHPEPDRVILRRCADVVCEHFGAEPTERFDGGDMVFWDYVAGGASFALHLDRARGLAIVAGDASASSEQLVRRIAEHLLTVTIDGAR